MGESGSSPAGERRGRARDAEATREAILDAGEQVFAEHGFDGARIDTIAEASGYNKSLIFQHFDDKLGLYAAVIRRADDQMRGWQAEAIRALGKMEVPLETDKISDMLKDFIGWYFDYLVEHPRILRIFNWELAEGWQTFSKVISERDYQDIDDFAPIFEKMEAAHMIRRQPNPFLQWTAALFTAHVLLGVVPLYRIMLTDENLESPAALKSMRRFIIDFVLHGLLPSEGAGPHPGSKRANTKSPRQTSRGRGHPRP